VKLTVAQLVKKAVSVTALLLRQSKAKFYLHSPIRLQLTNNRANFNNLLLQFMTPQFPHSGKMENVMNW
jgi:hypothetical protein